MRAEKIEPDSAIEACKRHVDRTLVRQNLQRSVAERMANLIALQRLAVEAHRAGRTLIAFEAIIQAFGDSGVECVIVGGLAASVHGSARLAQDVDFVYARSSRNLKRVVAALRPHAPYLRGAPPSLPFDWSEAILERGLDFTHCHRRYRPAWRDRR